MTSDQLGLFHFDHQPTLHPLKGLVRMNSTTDFSSQYLVNGLDRLHSGKVRDTFKIPEDLQPSYRDYRLVVASDRISVFDFVLNAEVKDKGAILNALNIFWRLNLPRHPQCGHDMRAYGSHVKPFLPFGLRDNIELQKRGIVVDTLKMLPIECIVRGYLAGSAFVSYQKSSEISGVILPPGLNEFHILPEPIFTPTTKAEVGHDEPISVYDVQRTYGSSPKDLSLYFYSEGRKFALERGIIIADTKFEFGMYPPGRPMIGDEMLTPDSSRFWDASDYEVSRREGRAPQSLDKQIVRDYAKRLGIKDKDPSNPEDRAWVSSQEIDLDILHETSIIYHDIFERLTGMSLAEFQHTHMDISF